MPALEVAEPAVSFSWTGSYVGVWGGGRIGDIDWATTEVFDPDGDPIPFESDPNASNSSTSGRVAVYAGYNWQFSPAWVAGIEADVGYGDNSARFDRIPGLVLRATALWRPNSAWTEAFVGVLAISFHQRSLVYGTGGLAFQEAEASGTCRADGEVCDPAEGSRTSSSSETLVGCDYSAAASRRRYLETGSSAPTIVTPSYEDFSVTAMQWVPGEAFGAEADISIATHTFGVGIGYKF